MPKAYIQLGASCSSPSICPARATGWAGVIGALLLLVIVVSTLVALNAR